MSQKLPVNDFKWNKNIPKSNEDFIKNYDGNSNIFLRQMLNIQKSYLIFIDSDLPFLSKRMKICKCNKLVCNLDGK